jgi:general secretion pathway protein I
MLNTVAEQEVRRKHAGGGRRQSGFTLLEVAVATTIAGLAMAGLFKVGSAGVFAVDAAGRVEEAIERAQSHLAAFGRHGAVTATEIEGEDGAGYGWRIRARPLITEQPAPAGNGPLMTLYDVEVMISWRAWGRDRSVVLATRRIGAVTSEQR